MSPVVDRGRNSNSNNDESTISEDIEGWIEKISKDKTVTRQMIIGGVSGWLTGFVAMKVGKLAATAIGGGIILVQIANHKGYIKINWNRINNDVEKISSQIQKEKNKSQDWTNKLEKKLDKMAGKAENMLENQKRKSWYNKLMGGEDQRRLEVFLLSFICGIGIGVLTPGK